MRLNSAQVTQALTQMEAQVLPDDHPAVTELTDVFGDHTFLLDDSGLKVLEPSEVPETDVQSSEVVAAVREEKRSKFRDEEIERALRELDGVGLLPRGVKTR